MMATIQTHCLRGHLYDAANTYVDKQGHRSCKECRRAAARKYWNDKGSKRGPEVQERYRQKQREWYQQNHERVLADRRSVYDPEKERERKAKTGDQRRDRRRVYYMQHRDRLLLRQKTDARYQETARRWREANREYLIAYKRANYDPEKARAYRSQNLERERQLARIWRTNNRSKSVQRSLRYRTRKRRVFVEDVSPEYVYLRDRGICQLCGGRVSRRAMHVDHIVPLNRGGLHELKNVQLSHGRCNQQKATKVLGQARMFG